jgi:hypothetical protein
MVAPYSRPISRSIPKKGTPLCFAKRPVLGQQIVGWKSHGRCDPPQHQDGRVALAAFELRQKAQGNARIGGERVARHAALSARIADLIGQCAEVSDIVRIGAAGFGAAGGGAARLG